MFNVKATQIRHTTTPLKQSPNRFTNPEIQARESFDWIYTENNTELLD